MPLVQILLARLCSINIARIFYLIYSVMALFVTYVNWLDSKVISYPISQSSGTTFVSDCIYLVSLCFAGCQLFSLAIFPE